LDRTTRDPNNRRVARSAFSVEDENLASNDFHPEVNPLERSELGTDVVLGIMVVPGDCGKLRFQFGAAQAQKE
jgi:hypothetical protein